MAVNPQHVVRRLFEEIEAEYFDFTITVEDGEAADRWVQLQGNSINLPYPHSRAPEEVLPAFDVFGNVEWDVESWEAGRYVTIDWGSLGEGSDPAAQQWVLAAIVARLLENYLGLPADSERWGVSEQ